MPVEEEVVPQWTPISVPVGLSPFDALPTPQRTQMWAQVAAEEGVGARSLTHNTRGVEGHVGAPGWD